MPLSYINVRQSHTNIANCTLNGVFIVLYKSDIPIIMYYWNAKCPNSRNKNIVLFIFLGYNDTCILCKLKFTQY